MLTDNGCLTTVEAGERVARGEGDVVKRVAIAAVAALALFVHGAAATPQPNIVVDTAKLALSTAADGIHTTSLSVSNLGNAAITVNAKVAAQPNCGIDVSPKRVPASGHETLTLILDGACDVSKPAAVTLSFAPRTTPASVRVPTTGARDDSPRWDIVAKSFGISLFTAAILVVFLGLKIRRYNHLEPMELAEPAATSPPTADRSGEGPIAKGHYVYAVATVTKAKKLSDWQRQRYPYWLRESDISDPSGTVELEKSSAVKVTVKEATEPVRERRIYRATVLDNGKHGAFTRVGEVKGSDEASFVDGWNPLGPTYELKGLGTNWSFKDAWIGNVTVGASLLVALFASSGTFGDAIGPTAKPALTAMAVAAAAASVFVGLAPLIIKAVGSDLSYTTVAGMLAAALFTVFGTIGQISAYTWQVWASAASASLRVGALTIGIVVGLVVVGYAERTLWYLVKTGALFTQPKAENAGLAGQQPRTALL